MLTKKRLMTFVVYLAPAVCVAVVLTWSLMVADRPAAAQQPPAIQTSPGLKVYPCPPSGAQAIAARLREEFRGFPSVRIGADDRLGQILVEAPPEIQAQIARRVTAVPQGFIPPATQTSQAPQQTYPAQNSRGPKSQTIELRYVTAPQIEAALVGTFGNRLRPLIDAGQAARSFRLDQPGGRRTELSIHLQANRVTVQGTGTAVDSCVRLIQALDGPQLPAGRSLRLISLQTSSPASVQRVAAAVGEGSRNRTQGQMVTTLFQPQGPEPEEEPGAFPPGPPVQPNGEAPPAEGEQPAGPIAAGGLGPVQIEMLEGLDVLVITGHQRDVDRVMDIIQQVEQLSAETEPVIVVHPLRHVNSEALATLITPLYAEVYEPRQGGVSITALVKPNSLLLVGRRENVQTVVDLVRRLDRQAAPETQMQVFRLRYAAATNVQTSITTFFGDEPTGLGTRVVVTADARSNALIVRASPRDMIEVAKLIEQIDTSTSPAVDELRVFELFNAQAEDVEQILEDAIGGQAAGPGAAGPGAAGQQAEQRSAALQFLAIDMEGQRQLRSGILTDVRITSNPSANTLVVSGPADSMELLAAVIRQLDQPPVAVAQIKVFQIINGNAPTLVTMLESLFGTTTAGAPAVQTAAVEGESSLVALRFVEDVRTNSIIASGTEGDLLVVDAILTKLDESEELKRKTEVYALKNAPANDVATAITSFLQRELAVQAITQETLSAFEQIQREVTVVAEQVSNKLIISATERYFDEIMDLVKRLDERPPMVQIEVLIAEVSLNDTDEFGVELGLQDSVLFDRSLLELLDTITTTTIEQGAGGASTQTQTQEIVSANITPGFAFNNLPLGNTGSGAALEGARLLGAQGLSHFGVQRFNSELGYGGLVLSGSNDIASILIRALKEQRRLDVLSRPQIMTLDNQVASILVGQLVPLVRDVTITDVGQSFSTQPPEEVGLMLEVWPRISPDDVVVMEVDAVKSEVGPEEEGIPVSISATGEVVKTPRINTTRARTTVLVPSGQTVVIGGLIQKTKVSISRRVPVLAEIPLLGSLFRYDGSKEEKHELLIILTPHVVRNQCDAEVRKQIEAARMSWCLSDVLELTDDPGLRGRTDEWHDSETDTVYPDLESDAETIPVPGGVPGQQPTVAPPGGGPFVPESMPVPGGALRQPTPAPLGPQAGPTRSSAGPPWPVTSGARQRHPLSSGRTGYQPQTYPVDGQRTAYQWAGGPAGPSSSPPGSMVQLGYDVPPLQNRQPPGPPTQQPYQAPGTYPAEYHQPYQPPTAQPPAEQTPLYR